MNKYFVFISLVLWGVFLVCIATFGGTAGADAAAGATFATVTLLFLWGLWVSTE